MGLARSLGYPGAILTSCNRNKVDPSRTKVVMVLIHNLSAMTARGLKEFYTVSVEAVCLCQDMCTSRTMVVVCIHVHARRTTALMPDWVKPPSTNAVSRASHID
jgi:hypothetical protein